MNQAMSKLPPDLSKIGDEIHAAAQRSLRRRRARRELLTRAATVGGIGALVFAALTPGRLGPSTTTTVDVAGTRVATALPADEVGSPARAYPAELVRVELAPEIRARLPLAHPPGTARRPGLPPAADRGRYPSGR
jgi:hypothetical protein